LRCGGVLPELQMMSDIEKERRNEKRRNLLIRKGEISLFCGLHDKQYRATNNCTCAVRKSADCSEGVKQWAIRLQG
jgi:hypothetical protein